ncbi:MAG: TerC family protein [Chitinophagales bacterium]
MDSLFTVDSLISLFTLSILEIVLGIDNVIFVSILLGRLPSSQQLGARRIWMLAGIGVRSALLMGMGWLVNNGLKNIFTVFGYGFNLRNLIMLAGGLFLFYKTVKEIHAKFDLEEQGAVDRPVIAGSFAGVVTQIILVDMVFSFDSIITAIGLARKVPVMIAAVIIAMIVMFFFAERVSLFIHRYPSLKMLALAFLLMIGFSLFFEGLDPIHHSHIDKGYIYFAMAFSFGVEILNIRLRKRGQKKTPESN